jgi:hypothetical protein
MPNHYIKILDFKNVKIEGSFRHVMLNHYIVEKPTSF